MTREEAIETIKDICLTTEQLTRVENALECLLSKHSLPSDLDAAAEKGAYGYCVDNKIGEYCGAAVYDAYEAGHKAGAEWMAGQGVTEEYDVDEDGIFLDSDSLGLSLMAYPPSELGCKEGDILVIQMRKKQ